MMELDLFAGIAVRDLDRAVGWYDRFFAGAESFLPNDREKVWTLAEQRHVYVELSPERAGSAMVTLFLADPEPFVAAAARQGIEPVHRETYQNGVRKFLFADPDGNEIGIGAPPVDGEQ
ncbi:MAG TPA: VOC family protein [Ruania sp.]|nr:VOC family protein [Ruania sp.]